MAKILDLIYRVKDDASRPLKKIRGEQDSLNRTFKTAGLAIGAATAAIVAAKKAYEATVGAVMDYNKAILDSARAVGATTEEMSRIVQVADDFGIGMDDVTKALELMTKNGLAPSIDNLADLADKANAMNDPTERAAYLARLLGRNWATLDPILQQGGDRFRGMAESVDEALVATEAEIRASEELRGNLDSLADSLKGLAFTAGNDATPALTDVTGFMIRWVDAFKEASTQTSNLALQLLLFARAMRDSSDTLQQMPKDIQKAGDAADDAASEVDDLTAALRRLTSHPWEIAISTGLGGVQFVPGGGQAIYQASEWGSTGIPSSVVPTGGKFGTRAAGGPVLGGMPYTVGERGPETFVPGQSGTIVPNNDALAAEVRHLVRTLPTILRDAVERR